MDINVKLQECFGKLGYHGDIPTCLTANPATSFLWQQFITNVKSKNSVDSCRKNIIINRLQRKTCNRDPMEYPIREIQVSNDLKTTKDEIERIKSRIQEKQNKKVFLLDSNKSNYLMINNLEEKKKEKQMKIEILRRKLKDMGAEIKQIDEMLRGKGLLPVSEEDSLPFDNVLKLLHTLVEKIEKLPSNSQFSKTIRADGTLPSQHYVSISQRPPRSCYSTIKKNETTFKRIQRFGSSNSVSSARSLFAESFKENDRNAENVRKTVDQLKQLDKSVELLPESCFKFNADDQFLISFQSSCELKVADLDFDDHFLKNESMFENSMNYPGKSNSFFGSEMKERPDNFQKAYSNKNIKQGIEEIYNSTNRRVIWTSLCSLRESSLREIRLRLESSKEKVCFRNNETNEEDILKLHFIHINNNLMYLKTRKKIKLLTQAITGKKADIERQLGEHVGDDRLKTLHLQLENIKLEAAFQCMQREINNDTKDDSKMALRTVNAKINKTKEDMMEKIKEVEDYIDSKEDLMQKMKTCQDESLMCARKLSKFVCNPDWSKALTENIFSNEILAFRDFSLDYNKNYSFTNRDLFYRNSMRNIILDDITPSDTLYMIASVLENPQSLPEQILCDVLRKRRKLQVLSSQRFPKVIIEENNWSLQELQNQEKYVGKVCESLTSNIRSAKTHQILNSSTHMKLNMELWLEMPFSQYISQDKMVEGKTYKEYKEKFDYFKNNK